MILYAIPILLLTFFPVQAIAEKAGKKSLRIATTQGVPDIIPSFPNQHGRTQRPLNINSESTVHESIARTDDRSRGYPVQVGHSLLFHVL
jgi:hypothetical protein